MGVSTMLNGTLGFAMLVALMFCMPSDIPETLEAVTFYPFMSIYSYAVGSDRGATAMVSQLSGPQYAQRNPMEMTDESRPASSSLPNSSPV